MTLEFDERGLLAPGIHDASFSEVEQVFGRFQRTDRRLKLVSKLRAYTEQLARSGLNCTLIIDGSFVMTQVEAPEDIDIILILPSNWDRDAEISPIWYNLLSRRFTSREFDVEVFPVVAGSERERMWMDFFTQVNIKWCQHFGWPANLQKGLVRIVT